MPGGSSLPYGNIKFAAIVTATPAGTSVSIATNGGTLTLTIPGLLPGDLILDVNRPSQTINGNTAPAAPWVGIANAYPSSANTLTLVLSNTSTLAVSTPIEAYTVGVARCDGLPVPTGFY